MTEQTYRCGTKAGPIVGDLMAPVDLAEAPREQNRQRQISKRRLTRARHLARKRAARAEARRNQEGEA